MKKILLTLTVSLLLSAGAALAQITLTFDDGDAGDLGINGGTYLPGDSFTFSITLNIGATNPPTDVAGYSLWFETADGNTGLFAITANDHTGSPFTQVTNDPSDFPASLTTANSTHPGFAQHSAVSDMGATSGSNQASPGTHFLSSMSWSISGAATPGTYTLMNTSAATGQPAGKRSVINEGDFTTFDIASSTYTIEIIPEPSTWALLAVGALGLVGLRRLRARAK